MPSQSLTEAERAELRRRAAEAEERARTAQSGYRSGYVRESIYLKQAAALEVDHNGWPLPPHPDDDQPPAAA